MKSQFCDPHGHKKTKPFPINLFPSGRQYYDEPSQVNILDDLGMERDTGFGLETIFSVIDRRYRSGKPMIVTTNMSLGAMQKPEDIHYQRIFDRVLEVCIPVEFTGPSLRAAQRKSRVAQFRAMLVNN